MTTSQTTPGFSMPPTLSSVQSTLVRHVDLYRWRTPVYQHKMLSDLHALWEPAHKRVLDVGGGTGLIAQAVNELFPVERVTSVDIENRFLTTLTIRTALFDGKQLPFNDGEFDCVTLINVLHHVAKLDRLKLLMECRRVCSHGPIYVKDHLSNGIVDDLRLAAMDFLGNVPFGGMVRAHYLRERHWCELLKGLGYHAAERRMNDYRSGLMELLFPNRLELVMRWDPIGAG